MSAKPREPSLIHLSIRFYRLLVRIYPSAFQRQYGELMVQVFRDSCLQTNAPLSPMGLMRLWGRTLLDTLLSVIEQYSNRGAVMTKSSWIQLSGWLMAAGSGLFVLSFLASTRPEYNEFNALSWPIDRFLNAAEIPMTVIAALCIAFGILGLNARFGKQAGGLGQAGLLLSLAGIIATLVGIVGLSISDSSPWWETAMAGTTMLFMGLVVFCIRCIQRNLLSRWNSLLLLTNTLWPVMLVADFLLSSITTPEFEMPGIIFTVGLFAAFGGMGLLGYRLQADTGKSQSELA